MCLVRLPNPPKLRGDWMPDASPTARTLGNIVCRGLSRYVGNIPTKKMKIRQQVILDAIETEIAQYSFEIKTIGSSNTQSTSM
jgi:hypothetical protein